MTCLKKKAANLTLEIVWGITSSGNTACAKHFEKQKNSSGSSASSGFQPQSCDVRPRQCSGRRLLVNGQGSYRDMKYCWEPHTWGRTINCNFQIVLTAVKYVKVKLSHNVIIQCHESNLVSLLQTTSEYIWTKREKTDVGTPLEELIKFVS